MSWHPYFDETEICFWRIDKAVHQHSWDSGEGSYRAGGRWNSKGVRVVYTSLDPSTAIIEVAVHKTFHALDTVAHVLTSGRVIDATDIHVVDVQSVPNRNWLRPGSVSAGQMAFGDDLIKKHDFVVLPSVVSTHSWNLIFDPERVAKKYEKKFQEDFALDPRLHPLPRETTTVP